MTDASTAPSPSLPPARQPRWWTVLLVASLAINLLVGAAVATSMFRHVGPERFVGAGYAQLIPRHFFVEIPRERRRALLDVLRQHRKDFRDDRNAAEAAAARLADALVIEPFDVEKVKAVVNEFAGRNGNLATKGGNVALEIIALLSADERKQLAEAIRNRANRGKERKK